MPFKRALFPIQFSSGEKLTSELMGLGFRFSGTMKKNANIEDTLIAASLEGMQKDDRLLSLLVDWVCIHSDRINVDRLTIMINKISAKQDKRFLVFWCALAQILKKDARFGRLVKTAPKKRFNYLDERTDFLIEKNGEDTRFKKTCLRIPNKVFRHRPDDIFSPEELAKIHLFYRYRIFMGATYRSDMWATLTKNPDIKTSELAKTCYGSYPTAFMVKYDYALIHRKLATQ